MIQTMTHKFDVKVLSSITTTWPVLAPVFGSRLVHMYVEGGKKSAFGKNGG